MREHAGDGRILLWCSCGAAEEARRWIADKCPNSPHLEVVPGQRSCVNDFVRNEGAVGSNPITSTTRTAS